MTGNRTVLITMEMMKNRTFFHIRLDWLTVSLKHIESECLTYLGEFQILTGPTDMKKKLGKFVVILIDLLNGSLVHKTNTHA